jgi:transcription initiation factor TFIIIB Brf1 subunit/transcription initiation factor TFIIB
VSFEVCVCASSIVSKRPTFGVAVTDQSNTTTTFGHGIKSNTSGNTLHHVLHCISVTFGYVSFEVCVCACIINRVETGIDSIRFNSIQQMTTSATIHAKQTATVVDKKTENEEKKEKPSVRRQWKFKKQKNHASIIHARPPRDLYFALDSLDSFSSTTDSTRLTHFCFLKPRMDDDDDE